MGKLVIEQIDGKIKTTEIAKAVYQTLKQKDNLRAELVFVDKDTIKNLNRETRNVDKITDVLSYPSLEDIKNAVLFKENFPTEIDGKYLFIGSIVLCEDRVKEQAKELEHSEEIERTYLIVHGLMHLFGYDHINAKDKKEMREQEKAALKLLGIED